jgi:hypothetical protein
MHDFQHSDCSSAAEAAAEKTLKIGTSTVLPLRSCKIRRRNCGRTRNGDFQRPFLEGDDYAAPVGHSNAVGSLYAINKRRIWMRPR